MFPHPEEGEQTPKVSRFSSIFENNQMVLKHMLPALIALYVDIENTGSTNLTCKVVFLTSLYRRYPILREVWSTKVNNYHENFLLILIFRHIAVLLKYLREFSYYREALHQQSKYVVVHLNLAHCIIGKRQICLSDL